MSSMARNRSEAELIRSKALEDLYVFGYQCTLFRDDEKAQFIEEGKHLIPWMGDNAVMVDRYDGRGHLSDLSEYDVDLTRGRFEPLTVEESQIEALCDEERYLELQTDIMAKMLYEEEELKRLNEALADNSYAAVGFSYDQPTGDNENQQGDDEVMTEDDDSAPFIPTPALLLPKGISIPPTRKSHAIIEKTALFISKHGIQMEIMMKTKQKDNLQFGFLAYEDELNPYYRHILQIIKSGKYMPVISAGNTEESGGTTDTNGTTATPVEAQRTEPEHISSKDFLDSIQSKLPAGQIANTPYAKLLSNLSRHTLKPPSPAPIQQPAVTSESAPKPTAPITVSSEPPVTLESSHHGKSKDRSHKSSKSSDRDSLKRTGGRDEVVESLTSSEGSASSAYNPLGVYYDDQVSDTHNNYLQTSSAVSSNTLTLTAVASVSGVGIPPLVIDTSVPPPTLSSLSARTPTAAGPIIPPSPDLQPIIDKMADYVARNGPEFEAVVKLRRDARFNFIEPGHVYHTYYEYKKGIYIKEFALQKSKKLGTEEVEKREKPSKKSEQPQTPESDAKTTNRVTGVSFSIKAKEDEVLPLKRKAPLLYESSSSSSDENDDDERVSKTSQRRETEKNVNNESGRTESSLRRTSSKLTMSDGVPSGPRTASILQARGKKQAERNDAKITHGAGEVDISVTTSNDAVDPRLAENLARDRLAETMREKQLQLQRKRKAALFASLLKNNPMISELSADNAVTDGVGEDDRIDRSRSATPSSVLHLPTDTFTTSTANSPSMYLSNASRTASPITSRHSSCNPPASPVVNLTTDSASVAVTTDAIEPVIATSRHSSSRHHSKKSKHSKSSTRHRSRSRSPTRHRKHKKRTAKSPPGVYDIKKKSHSPVRRPTENLSKHISSNNLDGTSRRSLASKISSSDDVKSRHRRSPKSPPMRTNKLPKLSMDASSLSSKRKGDHSRGGRASDEDEDERRRSKKHRRRSSSSVSSVESFCRARPSAAVKSLSSVATVKPHKTVPSVRDATNRSCSPISIGDSSSSDDDDDDDDDVVVVPIDVDDDEPNPKSISATSRSNRSRTGKR